MSIANKGKGRQCFIKTEFALQKKAVARPLDILLLEEPENHLSHTNMRLLIAVLLNSAGGTPTTLNDIPPDTAAFFEKAPDNNVLEFALSKKVILVEGAAEYVLLPALFKASTGVEIDEMNVHVISVGGIMFKRYLDLARTLQIRTAVIRDNDGNFEKTCVDNYQDYTSHNVAVFYETDNAVNTFEVAIYKNNTAILSALWT